MIKKRCWLALLVIFVITGIGCGASDLSEMQGKEEIAQAIEGMHDAITKVDLWETQEGMYRASIFVDEGTSVSSSSLIFMLSQDMVEIAREAMSSGGDEVLEEFLFFARTGEGDLLFKGWYKTDRFAGADLDNTPSQEFLNLARKLEVRPRGKRAIARYCRDEDNARMSRSFCVKALR